MDIVFVWFAVASVSLVFGFFGFLVWLFDLE